MTRETIVWQRVLEIDPRQATENSSGFDATGNDVSIEVRLAHARSVPKARGITQTSRRSRCLVAGPTSDDRIKSKVGMAWVIALATERSLVPPRNKDEVQPPSS